MDFQPTTPVFDVLTDIADYAIGTITLGIKVQLIGWTSIFEDIITHIIETVTPEPERVETVSTQNTEDIEEKIPEKLSAEDAGQILSNYVKDLVQNHKDEFVCSYDSKSSTQKSYLTYRSQKSSGIVYNSKGKPAFTPNGKKFYVNDKSFVDTVIHWCLKLGGNSYTEFSSRK